MRGRHVAAVVALGLAGCTGAEEDGGPGPEIGQIQEAVLWAACVEVQDEEDDCPVQENCYDLEFEEPCYQVQNDNGTGGNDPEFCEDNEYCCRDLPCVHGNEQSDKHYRLNHATPGCFSDRTCVLCPTGQLRSGWTSCVACCSAQDRECGPPTDSAWCGTGSCGTCASGETCTTAGCCKVPKSTACAGKICGTATDTCGGTYSCGSCPSLGFGTRTCVGGTACVPSCFGGRYYCEEQDRCLLPNQVCNL